MATVPQEKEEKLPTHVLTKSKLKVLHTESAHSCCAQWQSPAWKCSQRMVNNPSETCSAAEIHIITKQHSSVW